MVRAAGMPLRDGALPPGVLTVRVVRGTFSANLPNQAVTIDVLGGQTYVVQTGPDGRAQAAHLPVGTRVRAVAIVEGERLESEAFEMPAESGVRILLIAGGDAAGSVGTVATSPPPPSVLGGGPSSSDRAPTEATLNVRTRLVVTSFFILAAVVVAGAGVLHRTRRAQGERGGGAHRLPRRSKQDVSTHGLI